MAVRSIVIWIPNAATCEGRHLRIERLLQVGSPSNAISVAPQPRRMAGRVRSVGAGQRLLLIRTIPISPKPQIRRFK